MPLPSVATFERVDRALQGVPDAQYTATKAQLRAMYVRIREHLFDYNTMPELTRAEDSHGRWFGVDIRANKRGNCTFSVTNPGIGNRYIININVNTCRTLRDIVTEMTRMMCHVQVAWTLSRAPQWHTLNIPRNGNKRGTSLLKVGWYRSSYDAARAKVNAKRLETTIPGLQLPANKRKSEAVSSSDPHDDVPLSTMAERERKRLRKAQATSTGDTDQDTNEEQTLSEYLRRQQQRVQSAHKQHDNSSNNGPASRVFAL